MSKSREEKNKATKNAYWGGVVLFILVLIIGTLAYFHKNIGEEWTKVLEIVGGPFALGAGFFVIGEGLKIADGSKKYEEDEDANGR